MFEKLGKFHIKKVLGQGAMGEVYLGEDPSIGREVAIKTILPSAAQGDDSKERFAREAKAAGVLNHPNLVTIYEFGEDQGVLYIAMELVPGHDLQELMQDQSLTRSEALEVLAQVCDGLDFAHRQGIVHRDIKPSNIRVQRDGKRLRAKVMDFGVARVANSDMTATGMVMGTVSYMAPEYIRTGRPDPRSDLFAVGVILYECLSGRKPFNGDTTPTILYKIVNEQPDPIDLTLVEGISPLVRSVLDKGLTKDPEERYQTADEFAKALRAAKDPTWQGHLPGPTVMMNSGAMAPTAAMAAGPTAMLPVGSPTPATSIMAPADTIMAAGPVTPPPLGYPSPSRPVPTPSKSGSGALVAMLTIGALALALVAGGGYFGWRWWQTRQAQSSVAQTTLAPDSTSTTASPTPAELKPATPDSVAGTPAIPMVPTAPKSGPAIKQPRPDPQAPLSITPVQAPKEPLRESAPSGEFSPERLGALSMAEHRALGRSTMSEATALAQSNPTLALAGLRNSIAADPHNGNAYAWAMVIAYDTKRFSDMKAFYRQARSKGFSLSQLEGGNARLRTILDNEAYNHSIPGGLEGNE